MIGAGFRLFILPSLTAKKTWSRVPRLRISTLSWLVPSARLKL